MLRRLLVFSVCATCAAELSPQERDALARISADSMRSNVSFLASDVLEGRATPSRGLDVAAAFIAAQFRRAGLESVAPDGSYFQTANLVRVSPDPEGFSFSLTAGKEELELGNGDVRVRSANAIDLKNAPLVRLPDEGEGPAVEGKVVAGNATRYGTEAALLRLQARQPALILLIGRWDRGPYPDSYLEERDSTSAPLLRIENTEAMEAFESGRKMMLSVHMAAPRKQEESARNVAGLLRGSDPDLRSQYVLLTAHYDHLGERHNGANDNASGVASMIEIAAALAALQPHPARSILFVAFYGEELGLLGAYYYTRHPLEPLAATVADVNLEQLGRTDDESGPRVGAFAFTGPSYSDLPETMREAAKEAGVKVYTKPEAGAYFDRSDNYAFALAGVVSHTIVVAFDYPDYHRQGDDWQKLDYANMAKVDRGIAAGVLRIADAKAKPKWSRGSQTLPYRDTGTR